MARTVPSSAYFELLAQPADRVAYTFSLAIAENRGAENLVVRMENGLGVRFPSLSARISASMGAI